MIVLLAIKPTKISQKSKLFAQKAARSIVEVQPNVNNAADIVVLLEVLGYRKETVMEHGFQDFYDLAKYIYGFIDSYEIQDKNNEKYVKAFTMKIPNLPKRTLEGIAMIFPWLASLSILFITGVSLWMAWKLPIQITTAFVTGVFLGLMITEGPLQVFNRLFSFYNAQTNLGEVKRLLKRSYVLVGCILSISLVLLWGIGYLEKISTNLIMIATISVCTVSLHRASYMIIYAQKKMAKLIISYSIAFASLLVTYYFGQTLIHDDISRYFAGLILAFVALSIFAIHEHYKLTRISYAVDYADKPHFYNPISKTDKTIKSKFRVQLWETLPYLLFGTFYFSTMFTDRFLSWIYNPLVHSTNMGLPMIFNTVYHSGADLALVVLFPTSIIQYIMMMPIFMEISNISLVTKTSQAKSINKHIDKKYKKLFLISIVTSIITAVILNFAINIFDTGLSESSLHVLQIASIGNVFLAIFTSNSLFLMLLNKAKHLAIISIISTIIVSSLGIILGQKGFENIVFAYLASSIFGGVVSTIYTRKIMKNSSSILFARFV